MGRTVMSAAKETKRPILKIVKPEKVQIKRACKVSENGEHEWSEASTFPFCIWCGEMRN